MSPHHSVILPYPLQLVVVVNDIACIRTEKKQYRFPKSKKKRIRKKWKNRGENYRMEETHTAFKVGNTLVVSSKIYSKLKQDVI